jgi:hypothetical protein
MSNEPQHVTKNESPIAGHSANLLLGAEIGHRSRREGFPVESREALEPGAIEARRDFMSELGSTTSRTGKFHRIRELEVTRDEYVRFGTIALDYVAALSAALNGQCPTIQELAANIAHDPRIGHVNSDAFESSMRVLLSAYFSKPRHGLPLWSGSIENVYHAVVYRFPEDHPRFPGHNVPGALLSLISGQPNRLFNTAELGGELGFNSGKDARSAMIDPALQLLTHTGDVTQHPHQAVKEGGNTTLSVWSSKQGPWIKPPLLNPHLQILHIAAREDGGFLRDLWSPDWHHQRFSHKSVIPAADVLESLNLVRQDLRAESGSAALLKHVEVTEEARKLVTAWNAVPIGGVLEAETYNPLRRTLVTRKPVTDRM